MKIKRKKMIKLMKKVNRLLGLEVKNHPRGGAHKTAKKDHLDRQKNTLRIEEYEG